VHKKTCGHFHHDGRWSLYAVEPREITYNVPDKARRDPNAGVYEYDGKTFILSEHHHGADCGHKETAAGTWIEPTSD
jgi:hypothetical protein